MRSVSFLLTASLACFVRAQLLFAAPPALQPLIDAAKPGERIEPAAGVYSGPVVIDKPIILDGRGVVTIDGGYRGSVVSIKTHGATLQNMRIIGSGDRHNEVDAGIQVQGNFNIVQNNVVEDVLFGIDLSDAQGNTLRNNNVRSREVELGVQGDGLRLWHSNSNTVTDNVICHARDSVVWYSENNTIKHNVFCHGRYGLHFMYARYNLVEDNDIHHNSVGIFLMYSDGMRIRNNRVSWGQGPTSMGIGFKEASDVIVENNTIYYAGRGLYFDVSPMEPDSINLMQSNQVSFCGAAVAFHNDWSGNEFHNNVFTNNFEQATVNTRATVNRNLWDGNYWDDYHGFDLNHDGIGDTPYRQWLYSDQTWLNVPYASFYNASPILSMVAMIERLIPFSEPVLLLQDNKPLLKPLSGSISTYRHTHQEGVGGAEKIDPFGLYSDDNRAAPMPRSDLKEHE